MVQGRPGTAGPYFADPTRLASRRPGCEHVFVAGQATILHADLDSFYASVEQRDDPRLRNRAVIVGGGVVLAASYEAKAYGVSTAMGGRQALRLCPARDRRAGRAWRRTREASRAVFARLRGHDAARRGAVDRRGVPRRRAAWSGSPARRSRSPPGCGARCTSGSACRSPSASPARSSWPRSRAASPSRTACCVVPPDGELDFLHPLPVERLWGVGAKTAEQAARPRPVDRRPTSRPCPRTRWSRCSGAASGRQLHALAHNRDPRPVVVGKRRGSMGAQRAIGRGAAQPRGGRRLARRARRPRDAPHAGRRTASGAPSRCACASTTSPARPAGTPSRGRPPRPAPILDAARGLLAAAAPLIEERGITLVGVAVGNLEHALPSQLALPTFDRRRALDTALDEVRDRYGSTAVTRAVLLGRDPGWMVPLLPD